MPKIDQPAKRKVGRPRKVDKKIYRTVIRLNAEENAYFLTQFERSGKKYFSEFIADQVLNTPMKITYYDKVAHDFIVKLSSLPAQFRAVGNNYNQVVKCLLTNLERDKALRMLYSLEQQTIELVKTNQMIEQLIQRLLKYDCENNGR